MKCDVFISYSRKDIVQAESLCKALTAAGVDYWIDRNIHGSANFLTEITHYISSCKVVLFIASANSAESEWTQKEVLFALKQHKEILPYRIGNFSFENNPELDFIFTNIQWIESEREVVASLAKLGCCGTTLIQAEPAPKPILTKTYKVGDYYNDGVREGVVFEVNADGRHGKIVSMRQSGNLQWSSNRAEQKRLIGADSETDGAYNMVKVESIIGWRDKYPAFRWCADLGEGWYLPAKDELFTIYKHKSKLNPILLDKLKLWYWSSTEHPSDKSLVGIFCAWMIRMNDGFTTDDIKTFDTIVVRAVSAF
ncbi:MAG: TIR domain-containing protein [Alistipes sp.]|nr:TIR domain-containing protein [Alistipes sp.]